VPKTVYNGRELSRWRTQSSDQTEGGTETGPYVEPKVVKKRAQVPILKGAKMQLTLRSLRRRGKRTMPTQIEAFEPSGEHNAPPPIVLTITKAVDIDTSYTCFINTNWNGCLVVYAQTATQRPLPDAIRHDLLARGYALAVARCAEKMEFGQDKTYHVQQIQGVFSRRCGTPAHVHEIRNSFDLLPPVIKE
jgi:hypothetical protein